MKRESLIRFGARGAGPVCLGLMLCSLTGVQAAQPTTNTFASVSTDWAAAGADAKTEQLLLFARTSAIRSSARAGYVNTVRELLDAHPDWVQSPDLDGNSLLHFAVGEGHVEMALLLASRGAIVNATNKTGHTPLHQAALSKQWGMVALLVTNGADLKLTCGRGLTPLEEACSLGAVEIAAALVDLGADPGLRNSHGGTCLHLAAVNGSVDMGRFLLERGAEISCTNDHGQSPLHRASAAGKREFVEWLLREGANALLRDEDYRLPLELAEANKHEETARLLRLHLAEVPPPPDNRKRVLVLFFQNKTRDPAAGHWAHSLQSAVAGGLEKFEGLRVLSRSTVNAGQRAAGVQPSGPLTAVEARHLGELVEAHWVVCGAYHSAGTRWRAKAQVLNVATGKVRRTSTVTSRDFYDLRNGVVLELLKRLEVKATAEEKLKVTAQRLHSLEVIPLLSELTAAAWTNLPALEARVRECLSAFPTNNNIATMLAELLAAEGKRDEAERVTRQVLQRNPTNSTACRDLAMLLRARGELQETERLLRHWVTRDPKNAEAHRELAWTLAMQDKPELAQKEMLQALRLDPEAPDTLVSLGRLYRGQNKLQSALYYLAEAARLQPFEAVTHALLGGTYARLGDPVRARSALEQVMKIDAEDTDAVELTAEGYALLGDVPRAVAGYKLVLERVHDRGYAPEMVSQTEKTLRHLEVRLEATPVKAEPPRTFTEEQLQTELRQRLSAQELRLVVNPIAATPAMGAWARELTQGITGDEARARAIYEALANRIQTPGEHQSRTAQQIFEAWRDPKASFVCNEFTKLFLALAREVGLKAFYVHLERDYRDEIVYHDCAVVFLSDKALLVDPSYHWFGVPHRQFTVLDDVQVIAHHLSQPSKSLDDLKRRRIGVKLHPDSAWSHTQLVSALTVSGRLDEADRELAEARRLEPRRWDLQRAEGAIAWHRGDLTGAEKRLREAVSANPKDFLAHALLGKVLQAMRQFKEAAAEYRLALQYGGSTEWVAEVRRQLALINEDGVWAGVGGRGIIDPPPKTGSP